MKPLAKQYFETLEQAKRAKPRSQRKTVLTDRLKDLMTRAIAMQNRAEKRRAA